MRGGDRQGWLPLRAEHGIHQHEGHPAAVVAVDMGEHDRVDRVVLDPQFIERNQARRAEVDGEPNPRGVHEDAGLEPPSRAEGVSGTDERSEEHTSELQSLMRISYAVFCLKKKKTTTQY